MSYRPLKYVCDTINGKASASMPEKSKLLTSNSELEYLIQDNSIEEIATFKGDITHVEAYLK